MIYTTYFAQLRNLPPNVIPISICRFPPKWFHGLGYLKLAPPWGILNKWKEGAKDSNAIQEYSKDFHDQVLGSLSIMRVLNEIQISIPDEIKNQMQSPVWRNGEWHVALVCYEKPSDFCHRHLVAQWLRDSGCKCEEWTKGCV